MKKEEDKHVWIGMLTVAPLQGNEDLEGAKLAVVNVLYYTKSKKDYISDVERQMNKYGFEVLNLEDVELFDFNATSKSLVNKAKSLDELNCFDWDIFYTVDEES